MTIPVHVYFEDKAYPFIEKRCFVCLNIKRQNQTWRLITSFRRSTVFNAKWRSSSNATKWNDVCFVKTKTKLITFLGTFLNDDSRLATIWCSVFYCDQLQHLCVSVFDLEMNVLCIYKEPYRFIIELYGYHAHMNSIWSISVVKTGEWRHRVIEFIWAWYP